MVKVGLIDGLIVSIADKVFVGLGYVPSSTNMHLFIRQKALQIIHFVLDILTTGFLIHASLFFIYHFLRLQFGVGTQVGLVVSYGLFQHFFLDWIPRRKK